MNVPRAWTDALTRVLGRGGVTALGVSGLIFLFYFRSDVTVPAISLVVFVALSAVAESFSRERKLGVQIATTVGVAVLLPVVGVLVYLQVAYSVGVMTGKIGAFEFGAGLRGAGGALATYASLVVLIVEVTVLRLRRVGLPLQLGGCALINSGVAAVLLVLSGKLMILGSSVGVAVALSLVFPILFRLGDVLTQWLRYPKRNPFAILGVRGSDPLFP